MTEKTPDPLPPQEKPEEATPAAETSVQPQPVPDTVVTSPPPEQVTMPSAPVAQQQVSPWQAERQPMPGEQFPAAVIPQSPYQSTDSVTPELPPNTPPQGQHIPHPSGPLPTVQYPAPPPRKPRNKPVVALTVIAIVLFLGVGALGTLWLVERGDHQGTTGELHTIRDNLAATEKKLKDSEDARERATAEKQRADRAVQESKECLDAAKAFVRALSEADAEKHFDAMFIHC